MRLERPVGAVSIELAGLQARHEDVPIVEGVVDFRIQGDDAGGLGVIYIVEQQQLQASAAVGIDAEIDAARGEGGAKRVGLAG